MVILIINSRSNKEVELIGFITYAFFNFVIFGHSVSLKFLGLLCTVRAIQKSYCRSAKLRNTEIYIVQRLSENETIIVIQQIF